MAEKQLKPESQLNWESLERIAPYPRQAFVFVQEGLNYTVRQTHRKAAERPAGDRHVSGRQLCVGLRDYAIRKYGLMARNVLEHWNIRRTEDFGRLVFAMVDAGLMSRTDEDRIDDFYSVYSFDDAFDDDRVLRQLQPVN